jgi:hypothetical protein
VRQRREWLGLVVAAIVAGALLVVLVLRATGSDDALAAGGPPPQEATETVGLLASSDPAARQSAFDPEVAALGGEEVPELDAGSTSSA